MIVDNIGPRCPSCHRQEGDPHQRCCEVDDCRVIAGLRRELDAFMAKRNSKPAKRVRWAR